MGDEAEGQIKKTHSKVLVAKKGRGKFRIRGEFRAGIKTISLAYWHVPSLKHLISSSVT